MTKIKKASIDRTGMSYGHWIVQEQDLEKTMETGKIYWKCICDCGCGTTKSIRTDALYHITIDGCNNMAGKTIKKCLKCGKDFYPKKQAKTRQYCYECYPEEYAINGGALRRLIKQWALEYKGSKCIKCGYDKCIAALELHHRNMNEKEFSISDRNIKLNWEEIKKELDKCDVLCANCHREEHYAHEKEGD